ncbi:nuclear localized protein [Wolffia australiana]
MEEGWEEDLDVDDSDLPSLLPSRSGAVRSSSLSDISPLRRCSQSVVVPFHQRKRIPGPAGALQAAMHRQAAFEQDRGGWRSDERDEEVDEDFTRNPWLCALDFIGVDRNSLEQSIASIKALRGTERIAQIVGIVTSCRPNGLGDAFLSLKDPTGTIGASAQRKVLTDGNFGVDLSVGCVLVLKQVAIFSPTRSTSYLNITLNNMVKVFGKDCGPPPLRRIPSSSTLLPPPTSSEGVSEKFNSSRSSPKRKTEAERSVENAQKAAVPQWTDEELSLLFSDDQDLADLAF